MDSLVSALVEDSVVVAYTPYFKGVETPQALLKITNKSLEENVTIFKRYFFSDDEIKEMIAWYYLVVLSIRGADVTDELINKLQRPSERHLATWVAYQLVDKRRLYENGALVIGQTFTDGSDYAGSVAGTPSSSISLQIGSVS